MGERKGGHLPGTVFPNGKGTVYPTSTQMWNKHLKLTCHNRTEKFNPLPSLTLTPAVFPTPVEGSFILPVSCSGQRPQRHLFLSPLASNLSGHSVDSTFKIKPQSTVYHSDSNYYNLF